jgi:hypothetical protein
MAVFTQQEPVLKPLNRWCGSGEGSSCCSQRWKARRDVLVKGYVHEVAIICSSEVIARHRRSYQREDTVFDPLHYLALLEQKTRALDQVALLAGWELPECFARLRRLLEARLHKGGPREYVQVLRLLETFSLSEVEAAIVAALHLGTISFDGQASAVVPHRPASAAAGPGELSASATGRGADDAGRGLLGVALDPSHRTRRSEISAVAGHGIGQAR